MWGWRAWSSRFCTSFVEITDESAFLARGRGLGTGDWRTLLPTAGTSRGEPGLFLDLFLFPLRWETADSPNISTSGSTGEDVDRDVTDLLFRYGPCWPLRAGEVRGLK